jgi:hypothetical protein
MKTMLLICGAYTLINLIVSAIFWFFNYKIYQETKTLRNETNLLYCDSVAERNLIIELIREKKRFFMNLEKKYRKVLYEKINEFKRMPKEKIRKLTFISGITSKGKRDKKK